MRELVAKNALASFSLPAYLSEWVSVLSSLCMYMTAQTTKFLESHLQAAGWYLDCSAGFVPGEENLLFASLVSSVPEENIVTFEEPDIFELPRPSPKAPRGKGRAKTTATAASSQVVTRSASKTPTQPPTFLRSPSITPSVAPSVVPTSIPSAFGPQFIDTPYSGISLLSLPRKRKAALLDTSATSSEALNTLTLIKNVDMVQLMLDSELARGPFPRYTRIQEFIAKVCIIPSSFFMLFFLVCLFFFLVLVFP